MERLLNRFFFPLRRDLLGRVALRPVPRHPPQGSAIERERRFYELLLKRAFSTNGGPAGPNSFDLVVDVGCRNWSYAPALSRTFPQARLLGVEVDGWRRYWNLYRRLDLARAYAREAEKQGSPEAGCFFGDFRALTPSAFPQPTTTAASSPLLLFTFFYPFVSERPCLRWGLPEEFADWPALIAHARELANELQARALILSVHQGEWEAEISREAFRALGLQTQEQVIEPEEFQSLWPSPYSAHLFTAELTTELSQR